MIQKISLIIKKILFAVLLILLMLFVFVNTGKTTIQIIPFLYEVEIRVFLLVILSFIAGILVANLVKCFDIKSAIEKLKQKKTIADLQNRIENIENEIKK